MIFLVIGKKCSGKTYLRQYVAKKEGIITYEASDYIKRAKDRYKISSTRELLDKLGEDFVAKKLYDRIHGNNLMNYNIVISGFRTLAEVDYINNKVGKENIQIVVVDANNILCYLRNITRNRDDKNIRYRDFKKRQEDDFELGFSKIIKRYPTMNIKNNSTQRKFECIIDRYMDALINQKTKGKFFKERVNVNVKEKEEKIQSNNMEKIKELSIERKKLDYEEVKIWDR